MKHYEIKSEENYTKDIFHDSLIIFIDIDILFRETNINFAKSLQDMSMDISFDFNQRYNKNMYTHSFLQVICEHIKTQDNKVEGVINNIQNTFQTTLQNFTKGYQEKLKSIEDSKPSGILEKFFGLYNNVTGFIQFFGDRKNLNKIST